MYDLEFEALFEKMPESGCAKKHIAAGTYSYGEWKYATNTCAFVGEVCPRLTLKSGQGYELCQSSHAEARLADDLKAAGRLSEGVAWVSGHYWACEPCAAALKAVGVKEIRVRKER